MKKMIEHLILCMYNYCANINIYYFILGAKGESASGEVQDTILYVNR